MHPKELHEQIITSKLEALPIPDMADAIWARIERQLDIDLPSNEGGDVPEPPLPSGGGSGLLAGAGLLTVVGALIVMFFLQQPKNNNRQPEPIQTTINQPDSSPLLNTASKTPEAIRVNTTPPGTVGTTPIISPVDSGQTDLAASAPSEPPDTAAAIDATAQTNEPEPVAPRKDSIPKKRRGVQGISDADYRIVPKKDST